MNRWQFTRLQEIREHLKQAYAMLEKLSQEDIDASYLKPYIVNAEDLVFETLVKNLNKVEHDIIHLGIKE